MSNKENEVAGAISSLGADKSIRKAGAGKRRKRIAQKTQRSELLFVCPLSIEAIKQLKQSNIAAYREVLSLRDVVLGRCGCSQFSRVDSLAVHLYRHFYSYKCQICDDARTAGFVNVTGLRTHYRQCHNLKNQQKLPTMKTKTEIKQFQRCVLSKSKDDESVAFFHVSDDIKVQLQTIKWRQAHKRQKIEQAEEEAAVSADDAIEGNEDRVDESAELITDSEEEDAVADESAEELSEHDEEEDDESHECRYCGKPFISKAGLWQHEQRHKNPLKCTDCGEQFFKKAKLNQHVREQLCKPPTLTKTVDPERNESDEVNVDIQRLFAFSSVVIDESNKDECLQIVDRVLQNAKQLEEGAKQLIEQQATYLKFLCTQVTQNRD